MQQERTRAVLNQVDMSPAAVGQRLRDVAQLYRLGVSLQSSRLLGGVEQIRQVSAEPRSVDDSLTLGSTQGPAEE